MHPVIQKTLGGLSTSYFLRQLFFGMLVAAFVFVMSTQGGRPISTGMLFFTVISTLLYPYSRFVYESIVGFLMGENIFFVNTIIMMVTKIFTIVMCWVFALFVAPVGLAYLYYHHSRAER